MLHELANSWKSLTGGADGLYGFRIAPVLGRFPFDLFGRTGFLYAAAVLACLFFLSKALVNSPFGLTMRGIRDNPVRMRMLGVPVKRRLITLYAISAAVAGIAGGLSAQVTKLVGLDSLAFSLSGNVLVMLILGGTGSLYGAFLGATAFVVLSDRAAAVSPFHWLFALGILLILAVRYAPQGLAGLLADAARGLMKRMRRA
jgi:branched-chain amino acid transport system permease protein